MLKQRDAEIQRYGAAREKTARDILIADSAVQEIEAEIRERGLPREAAQ